MQHMPTQNIIFQEKKLVTSNAFVTHEMIVLLTFLHLLNLSVYKLPTNSTGYFLYSNIDHYMMQLLLLLNKMHMNSMRSYSHWKKEIPLYLTSYIKLLESKMLKKLKQKIINETHIWNISFFGVAQRDPYMEHQHYDVIDSEMTLNSLIPKFVRIIILNVSF